MSAPLGHTMLLLPREPLSVGDESLKVPTHISLLPWCDLRPARELSMQKIRAACSQTEPFSVLPGESIVVGAEGHTKQAQRMLSEDLKAFHRLIFDYLFNIGVSWSHPNWLGSNYSAHMTGGEIDTPMRVDEVTVLENIPYGAEYQGVKTDTEKVPLGEPK